MSDFYAAADTTPVEVSICCQTYNHAHYIVDALEGFLGQRTTFSFEVIVHDDASTDETQMLLHEFESRGIPHLRIVCEETNRHDTKFHFFTDILAPLAKGKYIAFCEGDDYWIDPYKLQKQYDFMETHHDFSFCFHNAIIEDCEKGIFYRSSSITEDHEKSLEDIILHGGGLANCTASFFCKADLLKDFPLFYQESPVGDYPLMYHLALCGKVFWMADPMAVYRYGRVGSWTVNTYRDSREKRMESRKKVIANLQLFDQETKGCYHKSVEYRIADMQNSARYDEYKSHAEHKDLPLWSILRDKNLSFEQKSKLIITRVLPLRWNEVLFGCYKKSSRASGPSSSEMRENAYCVSVIDGYRNL